MVVRSVIEFLVICLLIIGLCNEKHIIEFEQDCIDIVRACRKQHIGLVKLIKMYKEMYK